MTPWNSLEAQTPKKDIEFWYTELFTRTTEAGTYADNWLQAKQLFSKQERLEIMVAYQATAHYHYLLRTQLRQPAARETLENFWNMRREFLA